MIVITGSFLLIMLVVSTIHIIKFMNLYDEPKQIGSSDGTVCLTNY